MVSYLRWNRTRRPRLVSALRDRKAAWPELSGRGALAAARPRSRCVLSDGCPVVSVHFSFGLALQTGHRTDSIRLCVSGPVPTPISIRPQVFNYSTARVLEMVNFALLANYLRQNRNFEEMLT